MRVKFWGTRGSIPKAGPSTLKFGGNTSCVEIRTDDGTIIVLDCGTGAHGLGQHLLKDPGYPVRGHLLISHTHWDHIQGIPFFAPLFVPGNHWDIYAPRGLGSSLQETLAGQMQYTYFPVALDALGATIKYHDLVEGELKIGSATIRTRYLNHPALTLGYRVEADGASVVYSCDHEPHSHGLATGHGQPGDADLLHAAFMRDANLVIHDAQYTEAEYANKIGWGHSTTTYALQMCGHAGVERLALTHHDPLRDDAAVETIVNDAQARVKAQGIAMQVFAAAEGMEIVLPPRANAAAVTRSNTVSAADAPAVFVNAVLIMGPTTARTQKIAAAARAEDIAVMQVEQFAAAKSAIASQSFSLVMIDTPDADRLAIARALRTALENAGADATPVIVVHDREEVEKGRQAGVVDWLVEPFTTEYVRTRLRAWVIRRACHWQPAPLPPDENKRLAALDRANLLDTAREERFDRITRIAATTFKVPMAVISLVDRERQWFKSATGLSASETPRDQAFCAHAILAPEGLHVPDALLDKRFADNPLVTAGPRLRAYAGHPIKSADGQPLGTLCILDTRPRDFADAELSILKDLAAMVEAEIQHS